MYTQDELLPISALQHLAFCPRQCALIHLESAWSENQLTAEGRLLHERVHQTDDELREGILSARGLRLASRRLGLSGVADMVEFIRQDEAEANAVKLSHRRGWWRPFPVEYKNGRPKKHNADAVQLCAQALCIEEMLGVKITSGAIFYGKTRRRTSVAFDDSLRLETESRARQLHELIRSQKTPAPTVGAHCKSCSLRDSCLPEWTDGVSASAYIRREISSILKEDHPHEKT